MQFSETWLREWVNPDNDTATLCEQLTMAGLEVDSVHPVAGTFSGVVVGHVVSREQHPNADKLSVTKVDVGQDELLDIVCGAKNVRANLKVAVAVVGAVLGGDFKIKKAKLRGEPSHGMICSSSELGLAETSEGILELPEDAPIGQDFRDYLLLNDQMIDIELTPNRGDCACIKGLAREAAVINNIPINELAIKPVVNSNNDALSVNVADPVACPRYMGRIVRQIDNTVISPLWLQEKLRRSGIRSINPVVDVCNYVMIELGQPMHGFDLAKLSGDIQVRMAEDKESITLLDESVVTLNSKTLVIADSHGAQAIAGVMGGANSGVIESTTDVFLESAFFNPVSVRLAARRAGIQTDSSYRFERGVDYNLQSDALERVTALLLEITGGSAGPITEVVSKAHLPAINDIELRFARIEKLLGVHIAKEQVTNLLTTLGFTLSESPEGWLVSVPSYRFDIEQEADLIEEVARIHGYDNIPAQDLQGPLTMPNLSERAVAKSQIHQTLRDLGYSEAVTYSFVDKELLNLINPNYESFTLANPIAADMSDMRTTLMAGLISALVYNQNRQMNRIRLFETGLTFVKEGDACVQTPRVAMLAFGPLHEKQWGTDERKTDFFDMKGDVERLLSITGDSDQFTWEAGEHSALHPGQTAILKQNDHIVGHLGALHPRIAQHLSLNAVPFLCEIDLAALQASKLPEFATISKFPAVKRDLAILLDEQIPATQLSTLIAQSAGQFLHNVEIFDIYQGEGIEFGKKSVALGLTFSHPSRTLVDKEINDVIQDVVANLEREFNAQLRT